MFSVDLFLNGRHKIVAKGGVKTGVDIFLVVLFSSATALRSALFGGDSGSQLRLGGSFKISVGVQ